MSRDIPAREEANPLSPMAPVEHDAAGAAAGQSKPGACKDPWSEGFRFDDPYWDDAFDSWHNPTLRVCCRWG